MDSKKYNFLLDVLGVEGAQALKKAINQFCDLEGAVIPRAAWGWLETAPLDIYDGVIPGQNSQLAFNKSEAGFTGQIEIGNEFYKFENATTSHLVAALALALDIDQERISASVKDLDLFRLGKNLDLLTKAHRISKLIKKEWLQGGKGDGKRLSDFDPDEVAIGMKEEHEEHGGPDKVTEEIIVDHLTEDPHYYSKMKKGFSKVETKAKGNEAGSAVEGQGKGIMAQGPAAKPREPQQPELPTKQPAMKKPTGHKSVGANSNVEKIKVASMPKTMGEVPQVKVDGVKNEVKLPKIKMSEKPMCKTIKITKSQSLKPCGVCGERQFNGSVFGGCLCFQALSKSISSREIGGVIELTFGSNLDKDSVLTIIENLGVK